LFSLVIWLANGVNLQTKLPGVKSVIAKASGAKADHFVGRLSDDAIKEMVASSGKKHLLPTEVCFVAS